MALALNLDAHADALSKCYASATRRNQHAAQTARKPPATYFADAQPAAFRAVWGGRENEDAGSAKSSKLPDRESGLRRTRYHCLTLELSGHINREAIDWSA